MKLTYSLAAATYLAFAAEAFAPPRLSTRGIAISNLGSAVSTVDEVASSIDALSDEVSEKKEVINIDDANKALPSSPGLDENHLFKCDDSVEYWRNFQRDGFQSAQENLLEISNVSRRFITSQDSDAVSYWAKHVGRSGYFLGNAALGTIASGLHERFVANNSNIEPPININSSSASRLLLEAFLCYEQDYKQISSGSYSQPWDMELNHRQSSPINVLTQTGRFVNEAIGTIARRNRQTQEDKDIWIDEASPSLYPEYYRNAFHYQSDGWMSTDSANVYETSTETLFLGRQDAMQRTSLAPLVEYSKTRKDKSKPLKVLEIACGTGRFMTFMRDNLPIDTECTAVDLSPFYLDKARDNDAYWRKTRRQADNLGKDDIKPLRLVQASAENLPFEEGSFDAVVCVYLYHELPREARARVSAEMSRVLKKDGLLVFTDSIQQGDRPSLDAFIGNFEKMNEPYYVDYTQDDLPTHFMKEGLKPMEKTVRSTTKSLTFRKSD
eukprot:CAMPEP_0201738508 /NCGR_PEP_ID=MMETSP0593-20130828/45287_1 /ASSEMBLY_ACC=CAM_ASM_000672 /TAXON_ID=267983 /ORGANISM="Skeletonema japonicum, Strain CCMP2506" /LENGTH=496 /DNA_ID=CAMNT_0048232729 /DNA_START=168 /DNA_END=1658 /DNA_ORIENTATION=-